MMICWIIPPWPQQWQEQQPWWYGMEDNIHYKEPSPHESRYQMCNMIPQQYAAHFINLSQSHHSVFTPLSKGSVFAASISGMSPEQTIQLLLTCIPRSTSHLNRHFLCGAPSCEMWGRTKTTGQTSQYYISDYSNQLPKLRAGTQIVLLISINPWPIVNFAAKYQKQTVVDCINCSFDEILRDRSAICELSSANYCFY